MKKIILFLTLFFFFISHIKAYNPTDKDIKSLNKIKETLWDFSHIKGKDRFEEKINKIDLVLEKSKKDSKIFYALYQVKDEMELIYVNLGGIIEKPQIVFEDNLLKRIDFFNSYGKDITTSLKIDDKCVKHFDFVDSIARENDFPVELIIATWSKETNCNLYNPANGDGPFQIRSHYYEPKSSITLDEFKISVEKFIEFSRNKWNYFNTNKYHNYKERFGRENLNITYDNFTLREIKIHSILYNGISANTTLDGNTFANTNLNKNVTGPSDGLVTRFLKVMYWRINRSV